MLCNVGAFESVVESVVEMVSEFGAFMNLVWPVVGGCSVGAWPIHSKTSVASMFC